MLTADIRRRWLDFFESKGHTVVPSASLVSDDPTVMFNIAGMVPFVPYFLGRETPPWRRATSVQKCVRTLDIEEVGKTTRHGTFFQMNGNFSFGDYFKREAIEYAWEFLTSSVDAGGLGFDPELLWVTVHVDDQATIGLWQDVAGLPLERIQSRDNADNFWHTGHPGPGGYNSEIYFDRGPAYGIEGGPIADEERYIEIWNLVFMEYELSEVRSKIDFTIKGELPKKNIDTGLGLERVAFLLQGVDNMYEIDEVVPVISAAERASGRTYGDDPEADVRFRVVADHVRSALMIISDGVTPSNEGRGYILRRLIRRAVRAIRLLGVDYPVLGQLLLASKDVMKASYPELERDYATIERVALAEEEAFLRTLESGTQLFGQTVRDAGTGGVVSGERAFALHDTFGFPIDLTLEMAAEAGVSVDEAAFRGLMEEQRQRGKADARAKKAVGGDDLAVFAVLAEEGGSEFVGYEHLETESRVRGIVREGDRADRLGQGESGLLVLDTTPFYAESGGQAADHGLIVGPGFEARVLDVQRPVSGVIAHRVEVTAGELTAGALAQATVDAERRLTGCQAHSATHLVHAALRQLLGGSATQAGSFNEAGYLRFDFSYSGTLTDALRAEIEEVANLAVRRDVGVVSEYMTLAEAKASGAMALFGERYPDTVRVVDMGGVWSRELCGGTHVAHTSQIGPISFLSEGSIGSGTRRIEASVGMSAFRQLAGERALVGQLTELLKAAPAELPERISGLLERIKSGEKEIERLRTQQLLGRAADIAAGAARRGGHAYSATSLGVVASADELRTLALDVRQRLAAESAVVAVAGVVGERPAVVVATTESARAAGAKAGDLVKLASGLLGGGGGGRPDIAQGGGQDATKIDAALAAIGDAVAGLAG